MDHAVIIEKTQSFVRKTLENAEGGHDWWHIHRVWVNAKRIAETLGISTLTVRKHISNVYEKLQVNSKAQVMTLAHQYRWFE